MECAAKVALLCRPSPPIFSTDPQKTGNGRSPGNFPLQVDIRGRNSWFVPAWIVSGLSRSSPLVRRRTCIEKLLLCKTSQRQIEP